MRPCVGDAFVARHESIPGSSSSRDEADAPCQRVTFARRACLHHRLQRGRPSPTHPIAVVRQHRKPHHGKPVLILEGDSHGFKVDNPFSASAANALAHGLHPSTPVAENVTRMVVEGSDGRTEYVRLTVDPNAKPGALFSWERVPLQ